MKKNIIVLLLLIASNCFSQEYKYGVLVGSNFYDIQAKNLLVGAAGSKFNIGGFLERRLNNRLGLKSYLFYGKVSESRYDVNSGNGYVLLFEDLKLKTVQLHLLTKIDVKNDYNKGFYFLGGVRMTNVLDVESSINQNLADDFFKKSNFGALLGFGVSFAKHFSFEIVGDRNITGVYTSNKYKTKNIGAYGNLIINIESILRKD